MNKRLIFIFSALLTSLALIFVFHQTNNSSLQDFEGEEDKRRGIKEALEDNVRRTKDLKLGYPPVERMMKAIDQTRKLQEKLYGSASQKSDITKARWKERGPNNIGGRTRVIMVDANDSSGKTVFAGGVTGGLWKTENITADPPNWLEVNDYLDNINIGALDQDPNNPQVMYMGTGEYYADFAGAGIFKSLDGGTNWELLPAASNDNFIFTNALIVTPQSDIYAGTSTGLYRSQDGGNTWTKVLGSGLGATGDTFFDVVYASNGYLYVSNRNNIYRSLTGDPNDWEKRSSTSRGFMVDVNRVEIAVSASDPEVIYAIGNRSGEGTKIFRSTNGGFSWEIRGIPSHAFNSGENYARGQGWYDLEIAVDPNNSNFVLVGGIDLYRSVNGGTSWEHISHWSGGGGLPYVHADQHTIVFDEIDPGTIYFGNDGGVWRSENGGSIRDRNKGYNVTQFYACALHPEDYYFLGGTQDNGSLQLKDVGISSAREVLGGDGFYTHIDQNEPQNQLVSLYYGRYSFSNNGGISFSGGVNTNGGFVCPSDYDNDANILYSQTYDGDFHRWPIQGGEGGVVDIQGANLDFSTAFADPNVDNRVYFGSFQGMVVRVDDAHTGNAIPGEIVASFSGTVSSIYVEAGNAQHILVTLSNYGLANSIYETKDGGDNWVSVEGNSLPDIPVRGGIFNPDDPTQAMIATELGVWTTEKLDGANTQWHPPVPGIGIPLTRTTMLQIREMDNIVLASTYGRGLWTSDVFAQPAPFITVDEVRYVNTSVQFVGSNSLNADSYLWDLGDGTTSTQEDLTHIYTETGEYSIKLTINGELTTSTTLKILPDRPLPYEAGEDQYGGNFEGYENHYGVYTPSGTAFERGNSTIPGKNGTHSGDNAFVVGLNEQYYQTNSHTMLFLPNFDMTDPGIYEFSFWAKYKLQGGLDGFLVEYSTDKGNSWRQLGTDEDENWYNYKNTNLDGAAFPRETPYFTGVSSDFNRFKLNISGLAGNEVAFRFVFKSDSGGNHTGAVIDDVQISKYEGELVTQLTEFTGAFKGLSEVLINFSTLPEYYCKRFELEISENGIDFEQEDIIYATGGITTEPQIYSNEVSTLKDLLFFRLKVINENNALGYSHEFYSPIVAVSRNPDDLDIYRIYPNPFEDQINMLFNNVITVPVAFELFDEAGKLVLKETQEINNVYTQLNPPSLAPGVYFLRYQIGDQEVKTINLMGGLR